MSAQDAFIQFPLCALALPDDGLLERIISYGFVEAGFKAMRKLSDDERRERCRELGLPISLRDSWELAVRLGAEICGIRPGSRALERHGELQRHYEDWTSRHGREPFVRIRKDFCFKAHDGDGLTVREFRVLAAIYSSIGADPYRAVTERVVRVRAIGCKCVSVMNAENGSLPPVLSEKEARGTIARLHELGFYARVTPIRHGRKTFYSISLTDSELRERLLKRAVYSQKFAAERRRKDQELEGRIRKQKGDYNSAKKGDYYSKAPEEPQSNATEGRHEGDGRATEGDYDRNTLNRKPIDRKPMNDSPPTPSGGVHHSQASDVPGSLQQEIENQEIRGYVADGDVSKFLTIEQANRFFVDNPNLLIEALKTFKPAIKRGDCVELIPQQ
jgi:hypothetical protein